MAATTLNIIDFGILFILGLSIIIGVFRGATREILGIAGWIGAFIVVFYGLPLFRPLGRQYIQNPMIADAIVAGILFIISLMVFILISRLISSSVKGSMFGGLDRSLGLVFGFFRGLIVICLIYLAMTFFYPPQEIPESISNARFMSWVKQGADELKRLIPQDYLPHDFKNSSKMNPLDAKDLIENSIPHLEETVKNLSTLKPKSPPKPDSHEQLKQLIEKNDPAAEE